MQDLISGKRSLDDTDLQGTTMDWLESKDYNHFKNLKDGTDVFSLVCKRGNKVYATRKSIKMDEMIELLNNGNFDYPIGSTGQYRMTRVVFITVTFDEKQYTKEAAWASLRSTSIGDTEYTYGIINKFDANLSKIFGKHGKLVCKEAQENGYPAPHMLLILDKFIRVKLHKGPNGCSWRIDEPWILGRLGKDSRSRRLTFKDHEKTIRINPIWKHGFFDIQGIVKGTELKKHKNAFTYLFKYLIKCLDVEKYPDLENMKDFNGSSDKGLKTMLYTHLGNKCFRTRDISFGKGFKERLGLLPQDDNGSEPIPIWKRIKTIPEFIYSGIKDSIESSNTRKLLRLASTVTD